MESFELDEGWRFWRNAEGAGAPETVRVPHDAMLSEPRSADAATGSAGAYFPGGIYRYERAIEILPAWEGRTLVLEFEGVYRDARVLLDGHETAFHANGYTGFYVELSTRAHAGEIYRVAVIADNAAQPNSRWYSGSGIYRPVWLHVLPEHHIGLDGVRVTTISADPPCVRVETQVDAGDVQVEIRSAGTLVACGGGIDVTLAFS